jgi:cell division protein FtsI (penicillin-binding protein 3)
MASARSTRGRGGTARTVLFRRARFWLICLFFFLWALAILSRLFWLQVVRHKEYLERASKQQQRTFEVAPRRGILYDRNLRELAMTVQVDSIYAVPNEIKDADKKALAHKLAELVHTDPADTQSEENQIAARLEAGRGFAWIARRVTPEVAARVQEKIKSGELSGIYFQKEFQRFYPDRQVAAQVLGYVGIDDNGLGGLEQKFETQLHGTPGTVYTAVDARRHVLGSSEREPAPGRNLVLTIDERMQYLSEQALDHAMEKFRADNGTVVVQDVHTGQILALAIRPTFDPNQFRHTTAGLLRNHAVSDAYEPGSTFKLVAYAAALDQRVAAPDDMVDCQGGSITLAGRVIHDNQGEHYGVIPVHKALEVSSDVGAIKMALKVGQTRYSQYIHDFGFGSRTGLELPGETRGLLRPVNKWEASSIGSIAMGQEVGVTPIQLVSMVSAIANGGVYLPPHILMPGQLDSNQQPVLKAEPFKPGYELPNPLPNGAHRVISTLAAAQMRRMMEGVVLNGTGKDAQLNGYSSGGKTGTAQKIDPATHKYSKQMHVASFAGIAPVNNPVIAVAVVLDNPHGDYYGATVSAPVFAEVAQKILEYLGVPHDAPIHPVRNAPKAPVRVVEDDSGERSGDINALYNAINDLPPDDPLRGGGQEALHGGGTDALRGGGTEALRGGGSQAALRGGGVDAHGQQAPYAGNQAQPPANSRQKTPASTAQAAMNGKAAPAPPRAAAQNPAPAPNSQAVRTHTVVVDESKKLRVPNLIGLPVRKVIEQAAAAGLEVQITGSGSVREQAPAPGTMVVPGTQIVVRCGR